MSNDPHTRNHSADTHRERRHAGQPVRWMRSLRRAVSVIGPVLVAAAVWRELRKPAAERTWNGLVWGCVPYDFRRPTLRRFREALWNPDDHHLFTARSYGVGWSINLHELIDRLRALASRGAPSPQPAG